MRPIVRSVIRYTALGLALAAAFPAGERFLALMDQSGAYAERSAHPLTFGTANVYVGLVR